VFNGTPTDPICLAQSAVQVVQVHVAATAKLRPTQVCRNRINAETNQVMQHTLSVDAGCFPNGQTGWGMVLKNQEGMVIHSACRLKDIHVDPMLAEAMAVRWALQYATAQGIQSVEVISDALGVVNCVNKNSVVVSIEPWKLLEKIPFVMVKHVNRELNSEAHNLASLAKIVGTKFWLGNAPPNQVNFSAATTVVGHEQASSCF